MLKGQNHKIHLLQMVNGLAIGGGELKLLELVENLDRGRYDITICSVGQGGPLLKDFQNLGLDVFIFEKKHSYDVSQISRAVKLMKERDIDIVQTTLFYADVIGAYAAKLAKVPVVISWEAVTQPYQKKHLLAYRLAARKMDKIVAVSDAIRNQVINERGIASEKVMTIRYGVDLDRFNIAPDEKIRKREELGISQDEIIIGTVARLTEQKGHKYLISAAPEIIEKYPKVRFVFAGDGPLKESLTAQIEKLGIQKYFHFLGFRSDIKELLNVFDIFVLPSLYEGLPNVVLEAMACAKPVVATAVDGTVEAVKDNKTGFLVPSKSPSHLAAKITEMLSSKEKIERMGMAGRKRVEEKFSLANQIKAFEDLYESLYREKVENNKNG